MKLAQITKIKDLLAYVQAEYVDAQKYCNKTATLAIYSQTIAYLKSISSMIGSSTESSYVSSGKSMLSEARAQWYKDGCSAPGTSTSSKTGASTTTTPAAPDDDTSSGPSASAASIWGPLLLAGAGLLAIWYFTKKKGSAPKALPAGKTRRRVTKRTTRRRA